MQDSPTITGHAALGPQYPAGAIRGDYSRATSTRTNWRGQLLQLPHMQRYTGGVV